MGKIQIPEISKIDKFFDKAMKPLMWLLGGFKNDSLQEHHVWHIHPISPDLIDEALVVEGHGDDDATVGHGGFLNFVFHAPIFGGWKKYVVVGHDLLEDIDWHIGWHVMHKDTRKTVFSQLNKIKIKDKKVKVLKGSGKYITHWFAFNSKGDQFKLNFFDEGIHGDKKHKHLKLF